MERHLKERLTGATVMVLLGVTFIPMVLDNSPEQQPETELEVLQPKPNPKYQSRIIPVENNSQPASISQLPLPAENNDIQTNDQPVVTAEEPEQSTISPGANMAASNNRTDQGRVKRQTGTQIETDNPQVLSGWVVQLGSFSNRANAQGLVTGLQAQGYPAFIEELAEDTESIFRVRVGPELKREDAETIRLSLVEKTGIKGIILTYP